MRNLIGISGKIGSGKDTVGQIIQSLTVSQSNAERMVTFYKENNYMPFQNESPYVIKKFADKLKDCVCLLIGCTREQLEDQEFKNTPLGPEWNGFYNGKEAQMTPRLLLQLLGTDAGRNIIHPNIWVNASFADYTNLGTQFTMTENGPKDVETIYPNWIFTDMRFPNELEAIQDRGGLTIRVSKPQVSVMQAAAHQHESETALDGYASSFDYNIYNAGTIEELIGQVETVLKHAKII